MYNQVDIPIGDYRRGCGHGCEADFSGKESVSAEQDGQRGGVVDEPLGWRGHMTPKSYSAFAKSQ